MNLTQNLFDDISSFSQLRRAAYKAKKNARVTHALASYWVELESNLLSLQIQLQACSYRPSPYTTFMIAEPKPRRIQAAPFVDRIVHHSLCHSLAPHLERSYLAHSFACQKGKGNHKAVLQAKKFARKFQEGYCLKIDIRHCFETVNHEILMRKLSKRIRCKKSLRLCEQIISHGGVEGKGLPIGNLSSQHFANFYLDSLDHFCVEKLNIKGFIRYMDDILLFSHRKDHLVKVLGELTIILPMMLDQDLKHSATRLVPVSLGIPFLGFRIFPSFTRFEQSRKRRFIRKWKQLDKAAEETQQRGFHSLIAWSEQANTRQFRRNLLQ